MDGDGISWISQQDLDLDGDTVPETFATNGNSTTGAKNDWLFSPAFSLTGGEEYEITTIFNTYSGNGSFEAFIVDAPSSSANQVATLFSQTNIAPQGTFETLETNAYQNVNQFTPSTSGDYYIAYHSFGAASSGFILLFDSNIESTLSVDEFNNKTFKHFYNTSTDVLTLESSDIAFSNISLFNLLGQHVMSKDLNQTTETVDMSNLSDGVYLAKISIGNTTQSVKILKQ
ncbi:MAG: T9SS type A sorting domain-containing protein [Flavobacteriaceae bacterium]